MTERTQITRATAQKLCKAIQDRHFHLVPDLFTETARWNPMATAVWGHPRDPKDAVQWTAELASFEDWSFSIHSLTVEDERAVVEASLQARGPGVITYNNDYLFKLMVDERGQISDLKEWNDNAQTDKWMASIEQEKGSGRQA